MRAQTTSEVHNFADLYCIVSMATVEVLITSITCFKNSKAFLQKKKAQLRKLGNRLGICRARVENIDLGHTGNRTIAWEDNQAGNGNLAGNAPTQNNSNRKYFAMTTYLFIITGLYVTIYFVRLQTEPGAQNLQLALLCYRFYTR